MVNLAASYVPVISIGVPTYNRKNLLIETISSLLNQSFRDFEIIIGNDFLDQTLTLESLGLEDSRIRIVNNERNLGELENMNSLLRMARGRYFTWQFDDDPCAPSFLMEGWLALEKYDFPKCVFTSYRRIFGTSNHSFEELEKGDTTLFTGRRFLREYLSGGIKALGCCGIYDTDYLRAVGGAPRLTSGLMALHSEYLLLIRAGLLDKVAFINQGLVSTRAHAHSWTVANRELDLFKQAGVNLVKESLVVFKNQDLIEDFQDNLATVLEAAICAVVVKMCDQNIRPNMNDTDDYISRIKDEFDLLMDTLLYGYAMRSLEKACKNIPKYKLKAYVKMLIPLWVYKYLDYPVALLKKYSNRPF